MNTSTAPSTEQPGAWQRFRTSRYAYHSVRWAPLAGLALLTYALFPVAGSFTVSVPDVGDISTEEVIAQFDFDVFKTDAEMQREGEALAAQFPPIYEYRPGVADSIAARVTEVFRLLGSADTTSTLLGIARSVDLPLTASEANYFQDPQIRRRFRSSLLSMIHGNLELGVAASSTIENETHVEVFLRRDTNEVRMNRDSITTQRQYLDRRREYLPDPNSAGGELLFVKLLNNFFRATVVPNVADTESARAEARASVESIKDQVRENERIINSNDIVTDETRDRLLGYQQAQVDRDLNRASPGRILGQVLTNGLVVAVFWLLLFLYLPNTYSELRHMLVLAALMAIVILGAAANYRCGSPCPSDAKGALQACPTRRSELDPAMLSFA